MTIRLILGDQLNIQHSWYQQANDDVFFLMMEMRQETDYVVHHIQKVVGFFTAMRSFKLLLEKRGHKVHYIKLDDENNQQNLASNIDQVLCFYKASQFEYQLPDEYRLDQQLEQITTTLQSQNIVVNSIDTEHFLTSREELATFFKGKKQYLMESFYRAMRKKHNIMLDKDKKPLGGKWNYDAENRKKWNGKPAIPIMPDTSKDVRAIYEMIVTTGVKTIGMVDDPQYFNWTTTRDEALLLLKHFTHELLPFFGKYQDAMSTQERFLFHSRLSFAMNIKLISPKEVIDAVIQVWQQRPDEIDIAQVEGFVRQILGWREYMRGIYWAKMPDYQQLNYFNYTNKLPDFYWTGKTDLNCLHHSITQSLENAYAHHIQRLMVTGNFALLMGVDPDEVDKWYLGIYMDAIEWVEITNTRGMSQFADGGIVGTKPYIASANYMHKMGDYCKHCKYDKKKRTGEDACPFNALYWNFLMRHKDQLASNRRMSMMYRLLDKMEEKERILLQQTATSFIEKMLKL